MKFLKNLQKNRLLFAILLFGVLVWLGIGLTYGRFALKEIRNLYLNSKNFYFNCDKLDTKLAYYQLDNWSGVDPYLITFNMNSYKNNKKFSDHDINYDISYTCSSNINCQVTKTSGLIQASTHIDSFSATLTPNTALNDGDEVWIEVHANATSPYTKELKGKFVVKVGKMGLGYEIEDVANRPYLEVRITNTLDFYIVNQALNGYAVGDRMDVNTYLSLSQADKDKCASSVITLNFNPNLLRLDMTTSAYLRAFNTGTSVIDGNNYINNFSFKIDALSSETVRIYKQNTSNNYTYPFGTNTPIVNVWYN